MNCNFFRFNYDADNQRIISPESDPIPTALEKIILAHRFEFEQDAFRLLRLQYDNQSFIISKYPSSPIFIKGQPYYYTFKTNVL